MIAIAGQPAPPGVLRGRPGLLIGGLAVLLVAAIVLALGTGPIPIAPSSILRILLDATLGAPTEAGDAIEAGVVLAIRLPRIVLGALVGAVLALSGAVMQGVFRNPLADPGLLGVSSGAAVGALAVIVLGERLPAVLPTALTPWVMPLGAFASGLTATAAVYAFAQRGGAALPMAMLLAGIAINAMAGAATGILTFFSNEQQLRLIVFWTLGSLGHGAWEVIGPALVPLTAATILLLPLARRLDVLLLGEREAGHLGVDPDAIRRRAATGVALSVGAAVALTGVIGFVGIVAPHIVRLLIGPAHRMLLPASALGGAILILIADTIARTLVAPSELPIGVVTAALGGPFFLWLLRRRGA